MTPREDFSAMVARVHAALLGTAAGYTPRIRQLELQAEDVARRHAAGQVEREAVSRAIRTVEEAWMLEVARARRLARGSL